jgi:hypothetical protein
MLIGAIRAEPNYDNNNHSEVRPYSFHMNEDYHSVPDPLQGATQMTSTMAKYMRDHLDDRAVEPKGLNELHTPYNADSEEPEGDSGYAQLSESESSDEEDVMVMWRVTPDYGEKDHNVVRREDDTANGKKASGWTNPLSWHDDGTDDDKILSQRNNKKFLQLQYDEAEGPTKEDNGEADEVVVFRESDIENGKKFSGWTNPLSWTDEGADDETVLVQQKYDEAEGPTKEDNGELDQVVVFRESDIENGKKFSGWTNPLSWTDDGDSDETVV